MIARLRVWGSAMPYATVGRENCGDVELYYEDHGCGAPVVLIHGCPLSGAFWQRQLPALLKTNHRVVTYDRRGFGRLSQPTTGYDYDTFARDLRTLVEQLELRDFTLVGFSSGAGEVARYRGSYDSAHVAGAVIIAGVTPYLPRTADNPEGLDRNMLDSVVRAVADDRHAFFAGYYKNFYNVDVLPGRRLSEQTLQASWNVAAAASGVACVACVRSCHEDCRADVARIDVPTSVMHGDAVRIVPIGAGGSRTRSHIKGARLVVLKNGPHGVHWTHAAEVNGELLTFLSEHTAGSRRQVA